RDLVLTKDALYRLSYSSKFIKKTAVSVLITHIQPNLTLPVSINKGRESLSYRKGKGESI
ncbi:MAG: hypothetical protein ACO20W_05890, partial [Anaerohalosphaeraceae bacterium]